MAGENSIQRFVVGEGRRSGGSRREDGNGAGSEESGFHCCKVAKVMAQGDRQSIRNRTSVHLKGRADEETI